MTANGYMERLSSCKTMDDFSLIIHEAVKDKDLSSSQYSAVSLAAWGAVMRMGMTAN